MNDDKIPSEEEIYREYYEFQEQERRVLALKGLEMAFKNRLKDSDNYSERGKLFRWFHLFKLTICYCFDIQKKNRHGNYPDEIDCACPHYQKLYAGWEQEVLFVGVGVFRNWFYAVEHDGDWSM